MRVEAGDNVLIAGFIVQGNANKRLLIRGTGPSLAAFGIADALQDPTLQLFSGTTQLGANDNWPAALAATFAQVGAFPLTSGSRDAALLTTLPAGTTYTIQVTGANNTTGEALVEIYEVF